MLSIRKVGIVGFGEVGGIFAGDFSKQGLAVRVFDILLASGNHRPRMLAKARTCRVQVADTLADCLLDAQLVISAVTSDSCLDVAKPVGKLLHRGQIFLDINSVSPRTKRQAARYIEPSGAGFVEAAVMAAVPGARLQVPILLGGRHAVLTAKLLRGVGMNARALSGEIGVASAVKMCRSIIVKGLEALAVECLFAARSYGAEEPVLESLAASYRGMGWQAHLPDYLISRVAEHGWRRAAEMREVARALADVGIEPTMARATARRQEQLVCAMAARGWPLLAGKAFSWRSLADAIRAPNGSKNRARVVRSSKSQTKAHSRAAPRS
ncbi:MAG: NAD(P)-dependent oxidoreductase [Acidobacteria bacterium]|nr:NAD(P)-dependent oxidoreductase [Acidobacteriota bacterium]